MKISGHKYQYFHYIQYLPYTTLASDVLTVIRFCDATEQIMSSRSSITDTLYNNIDVNVTVLFLCFRVSSICSGTLRLLTIQTNVTLSQQM